ncbi:MAG: AAA family ATPase [Candidatus Mycalebacterium zealandia]|nr:MAG: AAA family ATPase [Candidatus Mycalebacterium zealandia]
MAKKPPEKIFLAGFMGVGKTTVGSVLAQKIGAQFCDLDAFIKARESASVDDIISLRGESEFRNLESEALAEVCEKSGFEVVATGGGIVLSDGNRAAMKQAGVVIYLKADFKTLMHRISQDAPRPLLKVPSPEAKAAEIFSGRKHLYETACFTVETDGLSPDRIAERVVGILFPDGVSKNGE